MNAIKSCLLVCALMLHIGPAHAWGHAAHELIAAAADDLLTSKARAAVSSITNGGSLADVANWMDEPATRNKRRDMDDWHYINMQVCRPKTQNCPQGQCAPQQIIEARNTLTAQSRSFRTVEGKAKSDMALKILVHLIADVHQPLHSADNHDAGGNMVTVENRMCGRTRHCSLHEYWDTVLPKSILRKRSLRQAKAALIEDPSILSNSDTNDPWSWAQEAHDTAINSAYAFSGFMCGISHNVNARVDQAYDERARQVISHQMARAALRLARTINTAYQ